MVQIAVGQLDYTADDRLPVCPQCGRRGTVLLSVDGSSIVTHSVTVIASGFQQANRPTDQCKVATTQSSKESKGRQLWLAWLNQKNGKSKTQRDRNFQKAFGIEVAALMANLDRSNFEWSEADDCWKTKT